MNNGSRTTGTHGLPVVNLGKVVEGQRLKAIAGCGEAAVGDIHLDRSIQETLIDAARIAWSLRPLANVGQTAPCARQSVVWLNLTMNRDWQTSQHQYGD